jgi:hypothetical protein
MGASPAIFLAALETGTVVGGPEHCDRKRIDLGARVHLGDAVAFDN